MDDCGSLFLKTIGLDLRRIQMEEREKFIFRHGACKVVSLNIICLMVGQSICLCFCFYSLNNNLKMHLMKQLQ